MFNTLCNSSSCRVYPSCNPKLIHPLSTFAVIVYILFLRFSLLVQISENVFVSVSVSVCASVFVFVCGLTIRLLSLLSILRFLGSLARRTDIYRHTHTHNGRNSDTLLPI